MIFQTKNSTYEVEVVNNRIRRVTGINPPTNHFSPDGEWKEMAGITDIIIGRGMLIIWPDDTYTATSAVESIEDELL